jgi:hypothetical protein
VEGFVDRLASTLESSDFTALRPLITPSGFVFALNGSEGGPPQQPDAVISRLRAGATDGKLQVQVMRRPILSRTNFIPPGDFYVKSIWLQFDNQPRQQIYVVVRNEGGTWYWSGALLNVPE